MDNFSNYINDTLTTIQVIIKNTERTNILGYTKL